MSAQRVRVTWEFDIDDSESAVTVLSYLSAVSKSVKDEAAVTDDIRITRFEFVMPKTKVTTSNRRAFQRRYVIQVLEGSRWIPWDRVGGGDRVEFTSPIEARAIGLATRELHAETEGKSWRIAEVRR